MPATPLREAELRLCIHKRCQGKLSGERGKNPLIGLLYFPSHAQRIFPSGGYAVLKACPDTLRINVGIFITFKDERLYDSRIECLLKYII